MASGKPTPILVCGKTEQVGAGIVAGLKPDYEVVQFLLTPQACIAEIPPILKGETPANPSSTLGTGNVTNRPVAIALGGGHTSAFDETRDAVEKACGPSGSGLAWLKNDTSKPGPAELKGEYGNSIVKRVKDTLAGLKAEGKLGAGETATYLY